VHCRMGTRCLEHALRMAEATGCQPGGGEAHRTGAGAVGPEVICEDSDHSPYDTKMWSSEGRTVPFHGVSRTNFLLFFFLAKGRHTQIS
jgi:hypothetical protein